jgi:uncharacterized protein
MSASQAVSSLEDVEARIESFDWERVREDLDAAGNAVLPGLLSPEECGELAGLYPAEEPFRSRIVMAKHGFGRGEYKYFRYPLPEPVASIRRSLYPHLAPVADRWNDALGLTVRYPATHEEFLARCHATGQTRPTPLLLRYGAGDYNCLHQDVYGEHVFPLQVAILLSEPGLDFSGGEFVMTEQRPRMQSRAEVVPLRKGDGVVFTVRNRPVRGSRGVYRVNLRHGVSRIRSGVRHVVGIIFHDAS